MKTLHSIGLISAFFVLAGFFLSYTPAMSADSSLPEFDVYDTNSNGTISQTEFAGHYNASDVADVFKSYDKDGNGDLDKDEFKEFVKTHSAQDSQETPMAK